MLQLNSRSETISVHAKMGKAPVQLNKVFVYGTLKRGEPNHHWLTRTEGGYSAYLANAKTLEKFPLIVAQSYNVPMLLDKRGIGHHIQGEVYEVDDAMFANLDILEDHPKSYEREVMPVQLENGETIQCWIYFIRNFPEHLLQEEYLESYRDTPAKKFSAGYYVKSTKQDLFQ